MKVIYSECSEPFWLGVAARLRESAGWEPCYWIAGARQEHAVRERFPGAVFHANVDAVLGKPARNPACSYPRALGEPLLRAMAAYEVEALFMMDRMDTGASFLAHERVRHYRRLVAYWLGVLEEHEPGLVVFCTVPHLVYDFILFGLCRTLGVPTVMIEFTKMRGLSFPMATYQEETELLRAYRGLLAGEDAAGAQLSARTQEYLGQLTSGASDLPFWHRPFIEPAAPAPAEAASAAATLIGRARHLASNVKARMVARPAQAPANYLKVAGRKPEESALEGDAYSAFRRRAAAKMRDLESYYAALARPVDPAVPYVYFPLNYQPERTTSPLAGVFVDQALMVDMVARSLPDGWQLYVKEHPTQFWARRAFRAQCARSRDFYDDLAALPNVQLVPMALASVDLIDGARAVAVVSGTAGWEAVNRGRPALMAGRPWYVGCEGVFSVTTPAECQAALRRVADGYRVDPHKVRLFVQALEQVGFVGYVEPTYRNVVGITEEQNVDAIAPALAGFWRRTYGPAPAPLAVTHGA